MRLQKQLFGEAAIRLSIGRGGREKEMPLNIRANGDVAILGNFGRLMNDPRYVDAVKDTRQLLDQGYRKFILDLGGVKETGSSFLGLLVSLTRRIRQEGGEVSLAQVGDSLERVFNEMRLDGHWDVFASVEKARRFFDRSVD
jgi:anti-sigma B factor antagonist